MRTGKSVIATAAVIIWALPLSAQEVRGRAVLPGSGDVVAGVIVSLVDSTGTAVDQALTSEKGTYRLRAGRGGHYSLRARRLGYPPSRTAVFLVDSSQVIDMHITLMGVPISLAEISVVATTRCDIRPDSGTASALVWDEARKVLEASMLTRTHTFDVEVVRFERRSGAHTQRLIHESEVEQRSPSVRPFVSASLHDIDSLGYLSRKADDIILHAPDETVLLSEQFAATHCLRLEQGAGASEIVLSFEPVVTRTVPEIRGTIHITRASGALARVEFTYVNLPEELRWTGAEGFVSFRQLLSGGWIVDRWVIRYPESGASTRQGRQQLADIYRGTPARRTINRSSFWESGGEVLSVMRGDTVIWQPPRPSLVGRVQDTDGMSIASAVVSISSLQRRVVADTEGHFVLSKVRPALRSVVVATPLQDSLGLSPFVVESDSRLQPGVNLVVPSRSTLFESACALHGKELDGVGFVRGTTRGAHGERVSDVDMIFSWYAPVAGRFDPHNPGLIRSIRTRSSAVGDYAVCGPRLDHPLTVRTFVRGKFVGEQTTRIPATTRILLLDIPVNTSGDWLLTTPHGPPAVHTIPVARAGLARLGSLANKQRAGMTPPVPKN